MIRITIRARDGTETTETDSNESRAVSYFKWNFGVPGVTTDKSIMANLRATGSYSCSHNGGMANIRRVRE